MKEDRAAPDERAYPARPMVGVGAVVLQDGCVLLVRRGREPMRGRWSLPGGLLELGETLREAAVREVFEETGIPVEPIEITATLDRIVRDSEGQTLYHYVLVDWVCRPLPGFEEPITGDDAEAARWVALERLADAEWDLEEMTLRVIVKASSAGTGRGER